MYRDQRDKNLMRVYRNRLSEDGVVKLFDLMQRVVDSPAERFWVSEERATDVIAAMLRGEPIDDMSPMKKEMYQEIFQRVKTRMAKRPTDTLPEVVSVVVGSEAPKFYLTPKSAVVIIHGIKKRWLEERKKKLRHLF